MRHIKVFLSAMILTCLAFDLAAAQPLRGAAGPVQGPQPPEAPPTFELDKKGKRAHINFALAPKPISDANLKFSHFANRKLMIFYFSAKCPHCQHAIPYVQKLADELNAQGFTSIAIAIKYNTEDDIRGFIRDYSVHLPVFYDDDRSIGENYGTGSIPLLIVINEKGEYIRYKTFDADQTPGMIKAEAAQLASAK
jgi:thiol-disulfide isomerase/thioredoxin